MTRKYDITKKSDMKRFMRDIERDMKRSVKRQLPQAGVNIACPHCDNTVHVKAGRNICPFCGNAIVTSFDWSRF
ncbi:hypothetical protein [[Collinsella] massiliensis]|uniref:hypothetical protein n=1 Tax=[Collinsella] massiliensis TaxID=1232426 RepID=UPI0011814733|nr:hypothetical protein [[Collinsella] massiliensis]